MISKATIARVQDAMDIYDVVTSCGVELRRKGINYSGSCPFHNERTKGAFIVSPGRGTYHCFSCKAHGDAISFVQNKLGYDFDGAIRHIAAIYNIRVEESKSKLSDKEKEESSQRETLRAVMKTAQEFFVEKFNAQNEEAKRARQYAEKRWGREYCAELGIGYAPDSWDECVQYCLKRQIKIEDLVAAGVARKSEKGSYFSFFRDRVTIPIKDRGGNIIAFTARYIGDNQDIAKYFNSPDNPIYKKSNVVFGINHAARFAAKAQRFIIVEGAPDVLTLQSDKVQLFETVATLGTAWTQEQFRQLKKITANLCFIPDSDPPKEGEDFGPGVKAVMRNGLEAIRLGFDVMVREIPMSESGEKQDPDSYITDRNKFFDIEELHFPVWYGAKVISSCASEKDKAMAVNKIVSDVLANIENNALVEFDISELSKIYGRRKIWEDALKRCKKLKKINSDNHTEQDQSEEAALMRSFGILIKSGCYGAYDKDGQFERWSNFTMKPLFHIIDGENAIRIFRLISDRGTTEEIEFRQDELVSLQKFQQRVESIGNYIFRGNMNNLIKLKEYMYSITKSAIQLPKMGWVDKYRVYAFGDGIFCKDEFIKADDLGMVEIDDKSFYLPAFSKMHEEEKESYQFERAFCASDSGSVPLYDYVEKLTKVFGDNAKVGFAFVVASLFHDVVKESFKGFPLLNVFGRKGSGKTELGIALMSFFIKNNNPPSLAVTTVASLNEILSSAENNVVHLDEYKNEIDFRKIEMLKGIWGGTGQTKKNMDGDKKVKKSFVRTGVIITGQDMPTRDDALFSRVIHLSYSQTTHTTEEKRAFEDFQQISSKGAQHLTIELLKLRERFESDYAEHVGICKRQLVSALGDDKQIEDRLLNNWLIPLAAFHLISTEIRLPYSYEDLFQVTIKGMREQQEHLRKNSDIAEFWSLLNSAHMQGKIIEKAHFVIKKQSEFKRGSETYSFENQKSIIYLNYASVCAVLGQRQNGTNVVGKLDQHSLESYLKTHPAYMGPKQYRFWVLQPNGMPDFSFESNGRGGHIKRVKEVRPMAFAFDYDVLRKSYDLSLEIEESFENIDD